MRNLALRCFLGAFALVSITSCDAIADEIDYYGVPRRIRYLEYSADHGEQFNIPDDGVITQSDMTESAINKLNKTRTELKMILMPETNKLWKNASFKACKQVYKLYEMGSMYPGIVAACNSNMNEYLIQLNKHGVKSRNITSPIYGIDSVPK